MGEFSEDDGPVNVNVGSHRLIGEGEAATSWGARSGEVPGGIKISEDDGTVKIRVGSLFGGGLHTYSIPPEGSITIEDLFDEGHGVNTTVTIDHAPPGESWVDPVEGCVP